VNDSFKKTTPAGYGEKPASVADAMAFSIRAGSFDPSLNFVEAQELVISVVEPIVVVFSGFPILVAKMLDLQPLSGCCFEGDLSASSIGEGEPPIPIPVWFTRSDLRELVDFGLHWICGVATSDSHKAT
jgi:hypothetical protein